MRNCLAFLVLAFWLSAPVAGAQAEEKFAAKACHEGSIDGMSCIPGGSFVRGSEADRICKQGEVKRIPKDKGNHRPESKVTLQTYYMDVTEVTYSAYQKCAKAGKCRRTKPSYKDYDRPTQPMVGVRWYDANQYCIAMGKHLPTEAEWEKAARGTEGELYPWGNEESTCELAVIMDKQGRSCGVEKKHGHADKGRTLVAKSRPVGRYGLYDMIGNAEEWTADWYTKDWETCGEDCSGIDPKGPCPEQAPDKSCKRYNKKSVRGGSWYWPKECATSWTRRPHFPANKPYHHFGFRCAASWEEAQKLQVN